MITIPSHISQATRFNEGIAMIIKAEDPALEYVEVTAKYEVPTLPDLLAKYDDWIDAANLFDPDLMQQLYDDLVLSTIAFVEKLDAKDRLVVELSAAKKLVWQMRADPNTATGLHSFRDPKIVEQLKNRIQRARRYEEDLSKPTQFNVVWKALDYNAGRAFHEAHPNSLKSIPGSNKRFLIKLAMFTPEDRMKIIAAIDFWIQDRKIIKK